MVVKYICEKCSKEKSVPIPEYWFDFMPLMEVCDVCLKEKECVQWDTSMREKMKGE